MNKQRTCIKSWFLNLGILKLTGLSRCQPTQPNPPCKILTSPHMVALLTRKLLSSPFPRKPPASFSEYVIPFPSWCIIDLIAGLSSNALQNGFSVLILMSSTSITLSRIRKLFGRPPLIKAVSTLRKFNQLALIKTPPCSALVHSMTTTILLFTLLTGSLESKISRLAIHTTAPYVLHPHCDVFLPESNTSLSILVWLYHWWEKRHQLYPGE